MYESVIALECKLDNHFGHPRVGPESHQVLPVDAAQWSRAVWEAAVTEGPVPLGPAEVSRGIDIARHPIFICGTHRSGTTLVRDLLDDHPALAVLPSEGTFLTNSRRVLRRRAPGRRLALLGCEWVRRLANPIHQAPYWVLGRSSREYSPYVYFARCLMAWWPIASQRLSGTASSWPLAAVALAYAHCRHGLRDEACIRHWAEKSPTNERFLARLLAEFPHGRVIHVIRHPLAVLASRAREVKNLGDGIVPLWRIARDLERSYRIAARAAHDAPDPRYLLLRYEDLVAAPRPSVERLAAFLGIAPLRGLLAPTVAGLPSASNSSFHEDAIPGRIEPEVAQPRIQGLDRAAHERISALVGDVAARLGYELAPLPAWRRKMLRAAARLGLP
jgi:hypothetical protein